MCISLCTWAKSFFGKYQQPGIKTNPLRANIYVIFFYKFHHCLRDFVHSWLFIKISQIKCPDFYASLSLLNGRATTSMKAIKQACN